MSISYFTRTLVLILTVLPVLILIYTRTLNREPTLVRLQAAFFLLPLLAGLTLFCDANISPAVFLAAVQAMLLMGLLFIHLFPPPEIQREGAEKLIYLISALPLFFLLKPACLVYRPWIIYIPAALALIAALLLIFLGRGAEKPEKHFNPALVMLTLSQLTLVGSYPWLRAFSVAAHMAAYILFFIYFYHQSVDQLQASIVESEEKLLDWERSIKREVNKRIYEIERSNSRLLDMAKTDPMTGVYNKINILSIITALTEDRRKRSFTILMFDIDKFKDINDTRGHLAGDAVIKQVARIASDCVRGIDSVGRYGGDEFLIVLPNTEFTDARFVAERLRKKVEEAENTACTISIGLASYPTDGSSTRDLIKAADEGLYVSKQKGRNRVSHHGEIDPSQTPLP